MPIKVQCTGCGKSLQAKDSLAGKKVKCPACKNIIDIPAAEIMESDSDELTLAPLEDESILPPLDNELDLPPLDNDDDNELNLAPLEDEISERQVRLDAADDALHRKLLQAIEGNRFEEMASILKGFNLWLISMSESDDLQPLVASIDNRDAMVVFTCQEFLQQFVSSNPGFVGPGGTLNCFAVRGPNVFELLDDNLGILFNPESEDARLFDSSCVEDIRTHLNDPNLKLPSVEITLPLVGLDESDANSEAVALRKRVLGKLNSMGFFPAEWMPVAELDRQLRSRAEIENRLLALACVFSWASAPPDMIPGGHIKACIKQNILTGWITPDERKIMMLDRHRANEEFSGTVGWRLENMWPLAWVLGYDRQPDVAASQIDQEVIQSLLFGFIGGFDASGKSMIKQTAMRSSLEVNELEDFFYCAHNAVRSAQFGSSPSSSVPADFDPVGHGGVVHERRHSLTWCLSPGTDWDDTDLST